MIRRYQEENVYEALQKRLHFLLQEFDNIYVSFSGGKDSMFFEDESRGIPAVLQWICEQEVWL